MEDGGWRLEVGGWRLEVGDWRLEVGGWRLEVGGCRLQVGGWIIVGENLVGELVGELEVGGCRERRKDGREKWAALVDKSIVREYYR